MESFNLPSMLYGESLIDLLFSTDSNRISMRFTYQEGYLDVELLHIHMLIFRKSFSSAGCGNSRLIDDSITTFNVLKECSLIEDFLNQSLSLACKIKPIDSRGNDLDSPQFIRPCYLYMLTNFRSVDILFESCNILRPVQKLGTDCKIDFHE